MQEYTVANKYTEHTKLYGHFVLYKTLYTVVSSLTLNNTPYIFFLNVNSNVTLQYFK